MVAHELHGSPSLLEENPKRITVFYYSVCLFEFLLNCSFFKLKIAPRTVSEQLRLPVKVRAGGLPETCAAGGHYQPLDRFFQSNGGSSGAGGAATEP